MGGLTYSRVEWRHAPRRFRSLRACRVHAMSGRSIDGRSCRQATTRSDTMTTYPRHGRLMTISAAAEYADVHPVTLRRWVAAGRLPAYRVGPRLLKIDLDELESIIRPIPVTSR